MTTNAASTLQGSLQWDELHTKTVAAAQATLAQAILQRDGKELPTRPLQWSQTQTTIDIIVGSIKGVYWKEQHYFLVDAALDETQEEHRHLVAYLKYHPKEGLLRLEIPVEAREGLGQATKVKVFYVEKLKLDLAQQWRDVLGTLDRGPRAVELWSDSAVPLVPWNPRHLPSDRMLNLGQQQALAAMTTPGGFFVWGPPGTGKTTVITSAVHRALEKQQSVLITSHTNVAVDNVLASIVTDDLEYNLGIMSPGQVIRHSGKDTSNVRESVREHDFLILEKAAAVLTKLEEKLRHYNELLKLNTGHRDRERENEIHEQLIKQDADIVMVRKARESEPIRQELAATTASFGEHRLLIERIERAISGNFEKSAAFSGLDQAVDDAHAERAKVEEARLSWADRQDLNEAELTRFAHEINAAQAKKEIAELRQKSRTAKLLPWVMSQRRIATLEASALLSELLAFQQTAHDSLLQAKSAIEDITNEIRKCLAHEESLEERKTTRDIYRRELTELQRQLRIASTESTTLSTRVAELRVDMDELEAQDVDYQALRENGQWELVGEYDEVLLRVTKLNEDRANIEQQKDRLTDKFEQTKKDLLATAPVIATTLTSLSFNPELQKRRFDVVIIDEAASAEVPSIIYAAAKAETTLAVVGDFLQNAPIADAEDATEDDQREVVRWQTSDIFALAGITDRMSAEQHPRCVPISIQYRYPPIIADVVNDFCYDGLLESHQQDVARGEPVITFLDTSSLAGLEFSQAGASWRCDQTIAAAVALATGITHATIGYVTPYSPQATAMKTAFKAAGLNVESGTSHQFQGREFDTVIFDLMQDDKPRWVAAANLRGPKRAVSAAKLLNVAMTRAKEKLYLIGNWPFVKTQESPGMSAIAKLEGHPNFEVRNLAEVTCEKHISRHRD